MEPKFKYTKWTYLFVELDVGRFELLIDIATDVVDKLGLGEGLAGFSLVFAEVGSGGFGDGVEGDFGIVAVSVLVKFDVGDFLVGYDGGIVVGHVARKFGEVGGHSY